MVRRAGRRPERTDRGNPSRERTAPAAVDEGDGVVLPRRLEGTPWRRWRRSHHARRERRGLSPTEQLGFCILLLIAGNITTTNLITNAIWSFAEQGIIDDVASGIIDREQAVDEVLRFRSPVQAMSRVTTEDTELDGTEIDEGERVTAWIGSANRDESVFDDSDEFLPERSPNRHIAFGNGIHYCLGAPLARLEADVALSALFDRYDTIEMTDDPLRPVSSPIVYGLESLRLHVE